MATVDEIETALVNHLYAKTFDPALRVNWQDGKSFVPTGSDETHIVVTFMPNRPRRWAISSGLDDDIGIFQVTVRGPKARHAMDLARIAQEVREHFAEDVRLSAGGSRIRIYETPEIDRQPPGDVWRDCVVTIRYRTE